MLYIFSQYTKEILKETVKCIGKDILRKYEKVC